MRRLGMHYGASAGCTSRRARASYELDWAYYVRPFCSYQSLGEDVSLASAVWRGCPSVLLVLGNRQAGQVTAALGGPLEAQGPHGQGAVIPIPGPRRYLPSRNLGVAVPIEITPGLAGVERKTPTSHKPTVRCADLGLRVESRSVDCVMARTLTCPVGVVG